MNFDKAKEILGLTGRPTIKDIRQAFRKMALRYHPDLYQTFTQKAWATRHFIRIREAYDFLVNSVATERVGDQYSKGLQDEETFNAAGMAQDSFAAPETSRSIFTWLVDKIPNDDTWWGLVLGLLLFPLMFVFVYYFIIVRILQEILQRFGVQAHPSFSDCQKKERFTFLIISSLAAFAYLPIFYWMAFTRSGGTSPTALRIVFGLFSSSMIVIFVLSEWISFILSEIWRRSIQADLELILPRKEQE